MPWSSFKPRNELEQRGAGSGAPAPAHGWRQSSVRSPGRRETARRQRVTRPLWAPWRLDYIESASEQVGCVFCTEGTDGLDGDASLVVGRGEHSYVLLNKFPYASGHLMIAPLRHIRELDELTTAEATEIHGLTVHAVATLRAVFRPEAFNVGSHLADP